MAQQTDSYAMVQETYPLWDIVTVIMQVVLTRGDLLLVGSLVLLVLLFLGDQYFRIVRQSSTTEAEYVAASEACKEAIWLTRLVGDFGLEQKLPVLHSDSQSAIALAQNPVFHAKTKHIDVRYHFVRECLADKRLDLVKVHTSKNAADALTKSLSLDWFAHCCELMGIG